MFAPILGAEGERVADSCVGTLIPRRSRGVPSADPRLKRERSGAASARTEELKELVLKEIGGSFDEMTIGSATRSITAGSN
jgi:hypothetical protein